MELLNRKFFANSDSTEIKGLTGLRGYAALWVFFLHLTGGGQGDTFAMKLASYGASGVTIFFVLSGFILSYVYSSKFAKKTIGYRSFMFARFARVYPLHLVTLILYSVFVWVGIDAQPSNTWKTFILNLTLLHAWGFTEFLSWNQPSWSVSTEFFSYLLFPLFIRRLAKAPLWLLLIIMAIIYSQIRYSFYDALINWGIAHQFLNPGRQFTFSHGISLVLFFWAFLWGCIVYFLVEKLKKWVNNSVVYDILTLVGVSLILSFYCATLWETVVPATLIIMGLSNNSGLSKLLFGNKLAFFMGKISYALYLSALMVQVILHPFHLPLVLDLAAAIVVATLLHYFIEQPARELLRKKMNYSLNNEKSTTSALALQN
ncbi:acyltransferase family protein [Legionella bozemanae]|uniref:O-acetyltransferase n=1 Tax=Legionella bozemanae TaxID=447 RepID=A0A0W0S228_LEGBO|nr:acyltransferase [Legionella bozemanae]KTC77370.1 O-acetyltransferase [Legionella bozemanae]STO32688.1 Acyltransferase family [Legionella bozemanae]